MSEYVRVGVRWPCAHATNRYLLENIDWLEEELGGFDDDYLIIDCPGSYSPSSSKSSAHAPQAKSSYTRITHSSPLSRATCSGWASGPAPCTSSSPNSWRIDINSLGTSLFTPLAHSDLLASGVLSAMSAMVNLELPWINIMSKMDLVSPSSSSDTTQPRNGRRARRDIARYLDPDPLLLANARDGHDKVSERENSRFHDLNRAIVQLVTPLFLLSCGVDGLSDRGPPTCIFLAS